MPASPPSSPTLAGLEEKGFGGAGMEGRPYGGDGWRAGRGPGGGGGGRARSGRGSSMAMAELRRSPGTPAAAGARVIRDEEDDGHAREE